MTTSKLLGVLFLVASAFFLIQSPGWQFGYLALSGDLAFIGLLLLVRRRLSGFSVQSRSTSPPAPRRSERLPIAQLSLNVGNLASSHVTES
jgi:hypothetical protein